MITPEQQAAGKIERISILREGYGNEHPEVEAWDEAHPLTFTEMVEAPADGIEKVAVESDTLTSEPVRSLAQMSKAELVAEAERLNVTVVPDSMSKAQIIAAIEAVSK